MFWKIILKKKKKSFLYFEKKAIIGRDVKFIKRKGKKYGRKHQ